MPEEELPEIPPEGVELRFPDLSLPHDLSDPVICLLGIGNYCNVLLGCYENDARRLWKAEDVAADSYRLRRQRNEILEVFGDNFNELQRHAEIYREACEHWQQKLCELTGAASRAMPEMLLSCKVLKLHPDKLYRRDNNTDWPGLTSNLKRLQVEAHRLVISKQEPKALAEAIRSFLHEIGCMRSRQRYLSEKTEMFRRLVSVGEHNRDLQKVIDELMADIEALRKNAQKQRDKVLALAILPPHPIDGVSPQEWRFRVKRDVNDLAVLVGGQHPNAKTELSDVEDKRFTELWQALNARSRDADNFVGKPVAEVGQVNNYYHAPVDQRQLTISAAGSTAPILANMAGEKSVNKLAFRPVPQSSKRKGIWEWLAKPVIVMVVGAAAVGLFSRYWQFHNSPTHSGPTATTTPSLRVSNAVP